MRVALDQLEAELKRRAPGTAAALRPGLAIDRLSAMLESFPHEVPAELRELYTWHDGTELPSGWRAELFPGGGWLPLADALKTWSDAMEMNRQTAQTIWDPRWLPLTTDTKDGFHVVECGPGDGRVIAFFAVDLPDGWWLEQAGLAAMIEALIRRWSEGVYWESSDGGVDGDDRALAALRRADDTEPPDIDRLLRDLSAGADRAYTEALLLLRTRLYPQAVPGLVAMLEDPHNDRHATAIELLGAIGDRAALPALRTAVEREPERYIRDYARKIVEDLDRSAAGSSS